MMKRTFLFFVCFMLLAGTYAQTGHFFPSYRFSNSAISSICQDAQGSLWIGTDYGLNRFDGYHFQTFLHDDADTTSLKSNAVVSLLCDREGNLWVGTNRSLDRFDAAREAFVHYVFPDHLQPRVSCILQQRDGSVLVGTAGYGAFVVGADNRLERFPLPETDDYFSRMFQDAHGTFWKSGFDDSVWRLNGDTFEKYHTSMGNPQDFAEFNGELLVACLHGIMTWRDGRMQNADIDMSVVEGLDAIFSTMNVAADGTLYIGTRGKGLYRVLPSKPYKLEYFEVNTSELDLRTSKISAFTTDRRGNLWVGCQQKGLLLMPQRPAAFESWNFASQGIRLGSSISSICEGDNGMTWCTVQGVGIYGFNDKGRVTAHPAAPDAVEFIFRDQQRRYWIGTDNGLFSYDPLTGRSALRVTFECDKFNDMTSDADGRIYISTFSRGFCVYDPSTNHLLNHNFYEEEDSVRGNLCNNWVMSMSSDRSGLIWMGTASGLSCYDPKSDSFRSQGWNSLLPNVVCFAVCELRRGTLADGQSLDGSIAIGTEKGLYLYNRTTRQVDYFPGSEALKDKAINYIVQGNNGDVWCSTSKGIWQYSLSSQSFIGHSSGNGLTHKEFVYGVGMHTDDDRIYFGHNEGLTAFSPHDVSESSVSLDTLQLMAFYVGGQPVTSSTVLNGVHITDGLPVSQCDYFTLSYLDHTVMMAFSLLNFDNPQDLIFEYNVNDGEWIAGIEGLNEITLGHLQPGTYRIGVRAQMGGEYTPSKVVIITVRSPWFLSLPAFFVYFILIAALVFYIVRTYRRRTYEQLNEEKMKFLINATHDIRSPLTLILAALKKLDRTPATETIEHNSKRILNLVNQILDVRKFDKQQMHLHCQQTDLVAFARSIYKMYEFNAKERNILFVFDTDAESIEAWIDRSQFDKVINNLLSNAFKYSYESGEVHLSLSHTADTFILRVQDNGVGIDADTQKHIFDRFYRGHTSRNLTIDGTGIGLNLCKMIVDMHHGTIQAESRTDGQRGTIFTVTLPLGNAHLKSEEIEIAPPSDAESHDVIVSGSSSKKRRVLIVDDDLEIARYIQSELGHYYKFGICPNGKEALKELLTNNGYDLVVSDVMMPEMDGFTMLRMIKTNLNLSHLPVILLTSKADVGNRLEGLERGADAFLAKPFDMQELHLTIDNLIQTRQRLKGKFTGAQQQADKIDQPEVKGNDEQLMERIMKAINKNLSDSDFNVEMLTQEVGVSRAQLHRKMKELTGLPTSEFIRNIRLEQAARLLKEQKINVTQVAYTVGFSNLAHFSTIFRKHFGVSPSEYAEQKTKD